MAKLRAVNTNASTETLPASVTDRSHHRILHKKKYTKLIITVTAVDKLTRTVTGHTENGTP